MRHIVRRKNLKKRLFETVNNESRGHIWQRRCGQAVLEYAVLIAIVAAAFISMSLYIKRAVQGSITKIESSAIIPKTSHEPVYFQPNW